MPNNKKKSPYICWFKDIHIEDIPTVGGKNASLGEMIRELGTSGVKVPNGFAITALAYRDFLKSNNLDKKIPELLMGLNPSNVLDLRDRGQKVRQAILSAEIPQGLRESILAAYHELGNNDVAVRSSATAEDLPDASFAGQQETYLNVKGDSGLLDACRRCMASLFTDRAISYREARKFDHFKIALSIGVQKMVRSDLASSGVMFSIDTETGFKNAVLINASYGLGENIVQGTVNPDEYYVFKPTLFNDHKPILQKKLGSKEFKLVYDIGGSKLVKNIPVMDSERNNFAITDDEILTLAKWACVIEDYYTKKLSRPCPMDMEWAKDGISGELFIVQARPETVQSQKQQDILETYTLKEHGKVLLTGGSVGGKIANGKVRIIKDVKDLAELKKGEILVTDKTDPDWEPAMKNASGIITNRGGRTCHAAIVSRELGLPAVVGTNNGTEILSPEQEITLSCAEGEIGKVFAGNIPFEIKKIKLSEIPKIKTSIMMNLANPEEAFRLSFLPNDGVGLTRMEFIINHSIKIHPMALIHYDKLKDPAVKKEIDRLTVGYKKKTQFFVDKLAEGVAMITAAFYPKDVIIRLSDFKTNEYADLVGGGDFEPKEENPMIGFRGASRYYDERYRDGFALECQAMVKVRKTMGLKNLKLMIPFCRTITEAKKVLAELEKNGLKRGEDGLEVYVMCEIPSNVISAEAFAQYFDGFSIGSNDLTQLTLGVDRDSEIIAHIFDERDQAVKDMISMVIKKAKSAKRKIGICGQAPSDYPEFAKFLVKEGIDSMSLSPDVIVKTILSISEMEK
jgi:pyruvate, water dikinase